MPTSHHASAHGLSRATTCSGLASVVKSRSWPSRPSSASRTDPPTSARSWPAAAKRRPSSSTTGATRSSSVIRLRCASDRSARGGTEGAGTGGKGTAREPPTGTTADVPRSGYHRQVTPPPSPRHGDDRRARGGGGRRAGARTGLRKVEETSAGGLVVDRSGERPQVALIGRRDRRGRLLWSLPKGHVESGETAEDAAVREVEEETGIRGRVMASLGTIDYWFVAENRRIHKTVHHYLLEASGGELSDADIEVDEVAWVALDELRERLAYAGERRLAETAAGLLADPA